MTPGLKNIVTALKRRAKFTASLRVWHKLNFLALKAGIVRGGARFGTNYGAHQALDGMQWARAKLEYMLSNKESSLPEALTPEESCKKYGGDACKY